MRYVDMGILKNIGVDLVGDRVKLAIEIKKLSDARYKSSVKVDELAGLVHDLKIRSRPVSQEVLVHAASDDSTLRSEKSLVTFILQNGDTIKINVGGYFNALSIKKNVLKHLSVPDKKPANYNVYITDSTGNLHLLFDVELVTICHSTDRIEKNRLILCPVDESPTGYAVNVSKKIISEMSSDDSTLTKPVSRNQHHNNNNVAFRSIFGQRPSSQLISTNLKQYFPDTNQKKLQETIRNSVRYSIRMSVYGKNKNGHGKSTVGDVIVNNENKLDNAMLQNNNNRGLDSLNLKSSIEQERKRFSIASTSTVNPADRTSKIELFSFDSDSDDEFDVEVTKPTNNVYLSTGPASWLKGARIGSGSFGTVYLGMNAITGGIMAVKQVELHPLVEQEEPANPIQADRNEPKKDKNDNAKVQRKLVEALQHEMMLLKELHHENIVTYLGSSSDDNYLNIFLEYVPGGSLNTMLTNYGPFEEPLIRNFTRQILIGLSYLHSKNIIHRDIKGANILIDVNGEVKISDFGISKKLTAANMDKRASLQGSVYWMAPEIVKQIATTEKADIWSVGCLVVEMFTGKHPFPNFSQMQAIFKIGTHNTPEIPKWCTDDAKDFLQKTFILDYKKRPSATELLAHNFLKPLIYS